MTEFDMLGGETGQEVWPVYDRTNIVPDSDVGFADDLIYDGGDTTPAIQDVGTAAIADGREPLPEPPTDTTAIGAGQGLGGIVLAESGAGPGDTSDRPAASPPETPQDATDAPEDRSPESAPTAPDALQSSAEPASVAAAEAAPAIEPLDAGSPQQTQGTETQPVEPSADETPAYADDDTPPDAAEPWHEDMPPWPLEAPLGTYGRFHPITRYLGKALDPERSGMHVGDTVTIPTGYFERTQFTLGEPEERAEPAPPPAADDTVIPEQFLVDDADMESYEPLAAWSTDRTAREYEEALFADQGPDVVPEDRAIGGGMEGAFAAGRTVLDVGSGEAVALLQLSERYPDTAFIGVDAGYHQARHITVDKPGVQLTHDDWHYLDHIPTGSVDTIISCRGIVPWAIERSNPEATQQTMHALSRVAKDGAVLRVDMIYEEQDSVYMRDLLDRNGWDMRTVQTATGHVLETIVAIKRTRE
jgi:ubiquinone/menaquinone biosynthesis C-methylase UbiE